MIDPTQNTKQMSRGSRGTYTLRANEDFKKWKKKIGEMFAKLSTDASVENKSDKVQEYKDKIKKQKEEVETKLKEMEEVADSDWEKVRASYNDSIKSIEATVEEMKAKLK